MLDLRGLAALRAVARSGSVAAAARSLGWSQPTVVHHLRGLDREVGARVTDAAPSGTRLTPSGAKLLPHALALLERADRALIEARSPVSAAALGVFPSAGARLVPPVVRALRERGHDVHVTELELPGLLAGLASLRFDAAILFSHPERPAALPPHVSSRPLYSERLVLVVPAGHPFAGARQVRDLAPFAGDDWIFGTDDGDPIDLALLSAARRAGFEPRASVRSDDYAVIMGYIEAGLGIALVPELLVPGHGGLAAVEVADESLRRDVELATSDYLDPALARDLGDLLVGRYEELRA